MNNAHEVSAVKPTIPAELRALNQWVCWRYEERNGKRSKPPINPHSNGNPTHASNIDPTHWTDFDTAVAAAVRLGLEGVGLCLTESDGLTGLDLDHVYNPDTGELTTDAAEVVARFAGAYTEISPSGTGIRIWCYGKPGRSGKCEGKVKWLEVYSHPSSRYLTVTGNHWTGAATAVTEQQEALDWLHSRFMAKEEGPQPTATEKDRVQTADDAAVLKRIQGSARLKALWEGDTSAYDGDTSGADLALANVLVRYCKGCIEQADRLFRKSGLGLKRDKWDEIHDPANNRTYGQMTLDKALASFLERDPDTIYAALDAALKALEVRGDAEASDEARQLLGTWAQKLTILQKNKALQYELLVDRLAALTGVGKRTIKAEVRQAGDNEGEISAEQVAWLKQFVYLTKDNLFADLKTGVCHPPKAFTMLAEQAHPNQWPCQADIAFAREGGELLHHDTYKPGQGRIVTAESVAGITEPLLNTYNAPILPEPKYDAQQEAMLIDHLAYLVDGNQEFVEYLLNFLATLVQFPGRRIHSSPVIIGTKGNGKSFVGDLMTALLGKSNVGVISTEELAGAFQDDFAAKQLRVVEEIKVQEDQTSLMNKLKPWITNPRVPCNRKGRAKITIDNVGNWIFFSNYEDAIRIENDERRYAIAISRALPKKGDYYERLFQTFIPESGGSVAGALFMLKNRNLSQFSPYAPAIFTEAREEMIQNTHSALDRQVAVFRQAIKDGYYIHGNGKGILARGIITFDEWADLVKAAMTYPQMPDSYGYTAPKPLSPHAISKAAANAGLVKLGRKRLSDGRKQMVYALEKADFWRAQSESAIAEYIDTHPGAASFTGEAKKPAVHATTH
ncbi:phage NrS-1 polymerase family protein [Candidatus Contendibacter odensensis]|uniref:SF3 helicase domain-containing protein n=1 Tax=Candidatus Contendobacter odensis Run_B_J11 TaxID=1400861 RepID=A0A7U7GG48_9GAMM|nr:DUF5906 domain-containing protein [Candidatus Contendobacter odensis]CDH47552.1 hypothetical protein BN874_840015 [Candidatus Contendobacter odensis Run_B_J11]